MTSRETQELTLNFIRKIIVLYDILLPFTRLINYSLLVRTCFHAREFSQTLMHVPEIFVNEPFPPDNP